MAHRQRVAPRRDPLPGLRLGRRLHDQAHPTGRLREVLVTLAPHPQEPPQEPMAALAVEALEPPHVLGLGVAHAVERPAERVLVGGLQLVGEPRVTEHPRLRGHVRPGHRGHEVGHAYDSGARTRSAQGERKGDDAHRLGCHRREHRTHRSLPTLGLHLLVVLAGHDGLNRLPALD